MEYRFWELFKWESGKPISISEGEIPIYGSNGIIGYTNKHKYTNKIILGRVGAYCGSVSYCETDFNATDNTLITTCNTDKILYYYAYYLLKLYNLNQYAGGAAQPLITQTILKHLKCDIPSLFVQRKIASILSTYDSLIENNTKRIRLLEQMAENLYKEWFVRFRFPGYENTEFVNGMPKEWTVEKIGKIIELFDYKRIPLSSIQRAEMKKIYPYYGAAELMDYVEDYIFDGKYMLLGEDGSVMTAEGFPMLQMVNGKFWVNNHAHVIKGRGGISVEFLYLLFKKMSISSIVTGCAQPKISKGRLENKKILMPSDNLRVHFEKTILPMFSQIDSLQHQSALLTRQRDLLLPRLMSGKLEVKA